MISKNWITFDKIIKMKKLIYIVICICFTITTKAQIRDTSNVVECVQKILNMQITRVAYRKYDDYIKVIQFSYYDKKIKDYVVINEDEIKSKYPTLIAVKINPPFSVTVRSNVNNLNRINPINFVNSNSVLLIRR